MASTGNKEQEELDAVLDAALDDLDDSDEDSSQENNSKATDLPLSGLAEPSTRSSKEAPSSREQGERITIGASSPPAAQPNAPVMGPPRPPAANDETDMLSAMMGEMLPDQFIAQMMKEIQLEDKEGRREEKKEAQLPAKPKDMNKSKDRKNEPSASSAEDEVDAAVTTLLEDLAKQSTDDSTNFDQETMMNNLSSLMGGMDELGVDFSPESVIDGMMEQLVSKDLMYEPMKQVAKKFPEWLASKKNALSAEEYANRNKQCSCFQKLVHVYETQPDNTEELMLLMQEAQEYGQPPAEIINEIAPGLELDEDGMPKFDPASGECGIM